MESSMFNTLLSLPLFQGLGHEDLTRILESTHLQFQTLAADEMIVHQDSACLGVTFVLEGNVRREIHAADRSWYVEESAAAPLAIGMETLYGSSQVFRYSYVAESRTRILTVDKRTIGALTGYFEVFRLNVLNMLSATIARQQMPLWTPAALSLEKRIVHWMRLHTLYPAGRKRFHISMRTLGNYLGEDYRYVSKALHEMERHGYITLRRNAIEIPAFEKLITAKI